MCNAPKFGEIEERTGYGGGYNERGVVEYIKREDSDDEFDEVSTGFGFCLLWNQCYTNGVPINSLVGKRRRRQTVTLNQRHQTVENLHKVLKKMRKKRRRRMKRKKKMM